VGVPLRCAGQPGIGGAAQRIDPKGRTPPSSPGLSCTKPSATLPRCRVRASSSTLLQLLHRDPMCLQPQNTLRPLNRRQAALLPLAIFLSPLGFALLNAALVSPLALGATMASLARMVGTMLAVACLFGFLVISFGLPLLVLTRGRRKSNATDPGSGSTRAANPYLSWLWAIPLCGLGFVLALPVRRVQEKWLSRAAQRGEPLVQALEQYRASHGAYPEELAELVPREVPSIPGTDMLAYPQFEYQRDPKPGDASVPYELRVSMPFGRDNDVLVRRPSASYPRHLYGGTTTPLDGWAHVRE
jgi:hypothetical protein